MAPVQRPGGQAKMLWESSVGTPRWSRETATSLARIAIDCSRAGEPRPNTRHLTRMKWQAYRLFERQTRRADHAGSCRWGRSRAEFPSLPKPHSDLAILVRARHRQRLRTEPRAAKSTFCVTTSNTQTRPRIAGRHKDTCSRRSGSASDTRAGQLSLPAGELSLSTAGNIHRRVRAPPTSD